jgi:hypothetical protein
MRCASKFTFYVHFDLRSKNGRERRDRINLASDHIVMPRLAGTIMQSACGNPAAPRGDAERDYPRTLQIPRR